jgi:hypothetical protein
MAHVLADRVKETTTSTGTGTINLAGATSGFLSFSAIGSGNTTVYCIAHQTLAEFEVGVGTYTSGPPNTLSRTTILASSNAGAATNFSAGTKDVFVTLAASRTVLTDASGNAVLGTPASGALTNCTFPTLNQNTTGSANSVKSNATTGLLQIAGPAAASTRVMTTPDANFTAARTDAAQTFTGVQTFSSQPIFNGGTASTALALDASKNVVSVTNTGSGNNVLATSPTISSPTLSGTVAVTGDVTNTSTGYLDLPSGTTAQRPGAPNAGMVRYNTDTSAFEGYGTAWGMLGGGATGGGTDQVFYLNGQTIGTNYTIPAGQNAGTFGDVTINSGVTVTVTSGCSWIVV